MGAKTKIDWANSTWNPVTGCLHGCEYCYARRIAHRFKGDGGGYVRDYGADGLHEIDVRTANMNCPNSKNKTFPYPFGFEPTFHRYLLVKPQQWEKPRNIFVCSMADLFGAWVPDEWIQQVFEACEAAPHHRYLFLTKNPGRYVDGNGVPNDPKMWYGTTVMNNRSEFPYGGKTVTGKKCHYFISIEPIMEDMYPCDNVRLTDWVIIGAETGNRKNKVIPRKAWVDLIAEVSKHFNVPVFMKENLRGIMGDGFVQEYPW